MIDTKDIIGWAKEPRENDYWMGKNLKKNNKRFYHHDDMY